MKLENELNQLINYLKENSGPQKSGTPNTVVTQEPNVDVQSLIKDLETSVHSEVLLRGKKSRGFNIQKFEFLMRSKLIDEYKKIQSYDRPYISVTELCSCLRKAYYERKKYEVDVNQLYTFPYLALIQEVGSFVHNFIQSIYGFNESEKTIISEKFKVKGRIDSISENYLVEFKTVDPSDFKNEYSVRDYHQSLIYSYILNTEYDYKIEGITIVYILRNFKKIVPFDLEIDSKLALSLLKGSSILLNGIEKSKVIDPIGATINQCQYCIFRKYCEKDKSTIKKPFESSSSIQELSNEVTILL